jgi:hypothetical protein
MSRASRFFRRLVRRSVFVFLRVRTTPSSCLGVERRAGAVAEGIAGTAARERTAEGRAEGRAGLSASRPGLEAYQPD